jgi:hypothetical protein
MTFEEFVESKIDSTDLTELRGGCSCHVAPPCRNCCEPMTEDEAELLGWERPKTVEEQLASHKAAIAHLMAANQETISVMKALGAVFQVKLVAQTLPGGRMRLQWVQGNRIVLPDGRGH